MHHNILFLCTGNYYRSRFAEILFNHLAAQRQLPWRAQSRGLRIGSMGNVGAVSPVVRIEMEKLGIACDTAARMPVECAEQELADAHIIIALSEPEHRPMIEQRFPHLAPRVEYWGIHDLSMTCCGDALAQIETSVLELVDRVAVQSPRSGGAAV